MTVDCIIIYNYIDIYRRNGYNNIDNKIYSHTEIKK